MKQCFLLVAVSLGLAACATSMTSREYVQASINCERANAAFEAQVACVNDFLLTRNQQAADYDVYYTWVKERNAIMELYASGEIAQAKTKLALLDAQNKYEQILLNRDMRDIAAFQAMEQRRPRYCRSSVNGGNVHTVCD